MPEDNLPFKFGIHCCSIYRNPQEQFSVASQYIAHGLQSKNQCGYVHDEHTRDEVCQELESSNIITDNFRSTKQLVFNSSEDIYLKDGTFNPKDVVSRFEQVIADSLSQGFNGYSVAAETKWMSQNNIPEDKISEYESNCNEFFPNHKIIGLCQYNENLFSPKFMINIIRTHPYLFIYGKFYVNKYFYNSPETFANHENPFSDSHYQDMIDIIINE